jgi:phage terminase large subunit
MQESDLILDYAPRRQFVPFHQRSERFACIVTHRRAGKTVACIQDLQRGATSCENLRPRFAYLSPFLKQSKAVVWDYRIILPSGSTSFCPGIGSASSSKKPPRSCPRS